MTAKVKAFQAKMAGRMSAASARFRRKNAKRSRHIRNFFAVAEAATWTALIVGGRRGGAAGYL